VERVTTAEGGLDVVKVHQAETEATLQKSLAEIESSMFGVGN
jgi:hypothetical protein